MLRRLASVVAALFVLATPLTACGSDDAAFTPTREYTLHLRAEDSDPEKFTFVAEDAVDVRVGDRVTFEVRNDGALPHDLEVRDPEGTVIGKAAAVGPGATLSAVADITVTGIYALRCNVGDHLTKHRMQALIEAKPAT
jgi:plastocyanin